MKNIYDVVIDELMKSTGIKHIDGSMSIFDDLNMSSLEAFEMLANVEEELGIEIEEESIGEIVTVDDMVKAIEEIVNKKEQ